MPTAPKLIAALVLAVTGWFAAGEVLPHIPNGRMPPFAQPTAALIGLAVGWTSIGAQPMRDLAGILSMGFLGAALTAGGAVLAFAVYDMLDRSLDKRYAGLGEALNGLFELLVVFGRLLAEWDVLAVLGIGGLLAATLAGLASRVWR